MDSGPVNNPHDALFRGALSRPEIAREILRTYLDPEVAAAFDWQSLEVLSASHVDSNLRGLTGDLLYRAKAGGEPAYMYILLEHQSTHEPRMALRILGYTLRVWEALAKDLAPREPLPPVLPIVLAQCRGRWKPSVQFRDLVAAPEALMRFVPAFEHALIDVAALPDRRPAEVRSVEALLRLGHAARQGRGELLKVLEEVLPMLQQSLSELGDGTMIQFAVYYAWNLADRRDQGEVDRILRSKEYPDVRRAYKTVAEAEFERGIERGVERGRFEGQRRLILRFLTSRFPKADPAPLAAALERIESEERLEQLLMEATSASSAEDFLQRC